MLGGPLFLAFLLAALVLAAMPGPGMLYVAARTLAGGRHVGIASSLGTGLGGLVHVLAGAIGVSALVMASATAFAILKTLGAAYLVGLGIATLLSARGAGGIVPDAGPENPCAAFRQGILVEALNPKTATFFLAFLPQFVDPAHSIALQFVLLGLISVIFNTLADVIVTFGAGTIRRRLAGNGSWMRRVRQTSGGFMVLLGAGLFLARRPAG